MISTVTNDRCLELRGLSTDEKPTKWFDSPIGNGSVFLEIDTGKVFIFDEENQEWVELA